MTFETERLGHPGPDRCAFIFDHFHVIPDKRTDCKTSQCIQNYQFTCVCVWVWRTTCSWLTLRGLRMILRDLRLAFRQMRKSRGYALAVVLTLTLGVGINTAVFSMVDGFLMRSLPYPQPDRVAALVLHKQGVSPRSGAFVAEDDDSHTGETWDLMKVGTPAVTLASWGGSSGVNLQTGTADGGAVRYVRDARVSADYFKVLGIPLYLGRAFIAEEDRPNGPQATILGYGLWQSTFRGDPQVVGKAVQLKGERYTVVGVLPRSAVTPSNADLF